MDAQTRGLLIGSGCVQATGGLAKALNPGSGHRSELHSVSIAIIDIGGIICAI